MLKRLQEKMEKRPTKELTKDERRERAHALFCSMRPKIPDRKLKALIKKAVSTQLLAKQSVDKANGNIIEALGLVAHSTPDNDPRMQHADDVAQVYDTIEFMAELMAKGEFKLDFHAVDCIKNIAPPYGRC